MANQFDSLGNNRHKHERYFVNQDGTTDHKFVVVLKKGLDAGVALNAASHMTACLVGRAQGRSEMLFVDYRDADGNDHRLHGIHDQR